MKIIVAPDKFKGSLSGFDVARAISDGIRTTDPNIVCFEMPMADGGDGFAAVMKYYRHTETIYCSAVDPLGRNIEVSYEWNAPSRTAIIEMAVASGLVLVNEKERNALKASSFGTGLMIGHAISLGANTIILGLGGSATTDAGTGILSALGFQLLDANGLELQPSGGHLIAINKITPPGHLPPARFLIAADVSNRLHGPDGAAHVYATQKGATSEQVALLDRGLENFAGVIKKQTGKDIAGFPGSGAAGGIAAGLMAYFPVEIESGIEMVIKAARLEEELKTADMIITGEGQVDRQSFAGKVVGTIAMLARKHGVQCVGICGDSQLTAKETHALGLKELLVLREGGVSKEEAIRSAYTLVQKKSRADSRPIQ